MLLDSINMLYIVSKTKNAHQSNPNVKQDSWKDSTDTLRVLKARGPSPLVPPPAAERGCSLNQQHEWDSWPFSVMLLSRWRRWSVQWEFYIAQWRCAWGWEMNSVGVQMSIFSILRFFIFIPIYCSQVYYVHVGFWVLVYPFYSKKKKKTVQNRQDTIKMFLYFHVSVFVCFFHIIFPLYYMKNKIRCRFHHLHFTLLNDAVYFILLFYFFLVKLQDVM